MAAEWFDFFRGVATLFANIMFVKYFLFLFLAPFYPLKEALRRRKAAKKGDFKNFTVSVIVPAWNEEVGVIKTMESVLDNTYENIELVVINDGSSDDTDKNIKAFIRKVGTLKKDHPWKNKKISYISKTNGGKGTALNIGITKSTGEIILTIDADSKLELDAIQNLVAYYQDPEIAGVVGNVVVANSNTIIGLAQKLEYLFGFYFKRAHAVMGAEYIFGGACASFRRTVFDEIGLYDEKNKTEDIEMTMRFRYYGYNCTYGEDVICYTEGASDVVGLINQRKRWSKGRMDTFIKYRHMFFSKDKRHNKMLTHFVLPYALLSELQLLVEPISIALLLVYSFIGLDFLSIAIGIFSVSILYTVNAFFNGKRIKGSLLLLFPITWPLFYFLIWVEFVAHLSSIGMVLRGEDIVWQKWERKGI